MYSYFKKPIGVVAHRGDSMFFPENSFPAFKSALELGVDIIETDVHISKDGVVFIWHDEDFSLIDGSSRHVAEYLWEDIQKLDIGSLFIDQSGTKSFEGKGHRIMKFSEALISFPDTRFNVDLKDRRDDLVQNFYNILVENSALDRVVVASFSSENLRLIRKIDSNVITSYGKEEVLRIVILNKLRLTWMIRLFYKKLPPVIQVPEISGSIRVVTSNFISSLHRLGIKIQVWTINDEPDMRRLYRMGVDGVMTDDPRTLLKVKGSL